MDFAEALTNESRLTFTENGATAYNTTGDKLLDFFGSAGSLRNADTLRVERLFADALAEDKLLTAKALFYVRDIRGGLGERQTFRTLLRYAAINHPEMIKNNIVLIGEYGRFDDLYELVDTPLEADMWAYVARKLSFDTQAMHDGKPCSLLAKWLKTADASSANTRKLGIMTARKLGMSVYDYKRTLRALRKYIDVTEAKMSTRRWDEINYENVPSRAMMNYRNAFERHDTERYNEFINKVSTGEAKINASTLFPYDLIEAYLKESTGSRWGFDFSSLKHNAAIEAQWAALPDYVESEANALVIADTSGSMYGRPICSAVGLAVYFAQRNRGAYHNLWMSFSRDSKVQTLKGETLAQQLASIDTNHWDGNTNLERAFEHVLEIAENNQVSPDDMVKSIIVVSDMEIDYCTGSWSFYDEMRNRYRAAGYEIPNIVFWNVNSRHDIFHADKDRAGVQLVSGQSAATFRQLMKSVGLTPTEMMLATLNSERYAPITLAE